MKNYIFIALRVLVSFILLQPLLYKFTAHQDSVFIFTQVRMEPWGRIGVEVLELSSSELLFLPRKIWLGAGLASVLMSGEVFIKITKLGIEFNSDYGLLFYTAVLKLMLSLIILCNHKKDITFLSIQ